MLYLHGRNPLVPDGSNYIITGDSGQVGAWLVESLSMGAANPDALPHCCVWVAMIIILISSRSCIRPAIPPLGPSCNGHLLQGMTGGTIGGIVVADLILGRHEQGGI